MNSEAVMAQYGAQLILAGNDRDCPLLVGVKHWTEADEIAVAMKERAKATLH
jgi:hypothetical protein